MSETQSIAGVWVEGSVPPESGTYLVRCQDGIFERYAVAGWFTIEDCAQLTDWDSDDACVQDPHWRLTVSDDEERWLPWVVTHYRRIVPPGQIEQLPDRPDVEGAMARAEAATPEPWRWEINRKGKQVRLSGGSRRFDLSVMAFDRWGTNGAAPLFLGENSLLVRADELACPVSDREHHADWFAAVVHHDAEFIAAARTDVPALCRYVLHLERLLAGETGGAL